MEGISQKRLRIGWTRNKALFIGLLFASPMILNLLFLNVYPVCLSFYYSFTRFSGLSGSPEWIGLGNYRALILHDDTYHQSLYNSLYYAFGAIPLTTFTGVTLAMLLNLDIRGQSIYRTIYFLPVLVPAVAVSIIWMWVFNAQWGIVNSLLWQIFRIQGPGWLSSPKWSKPTVILMATWTVGQAVVTYLAGLQDVPQSLYDAAEVDGANGFQKILNVTLPMISPVIFFNLVMSIIGSLQYFTTVYVISQGDGRPAQSLMFYAMYLYRNAFQLWKMGLASAQAWILFVIVLVVTYFVFRSSGRWVYYGGK